MEFNTTVPYTGPLTTAAVRTVPASLLSTPCPAAFVSGVFSSVLYASLTAKGFAPVARTAIVTMAALLSWGVAAASWTW